MSQKPTKPKIGQGALQAAGRKGIRELGNALQAFPTSLPLIDETGQLFSATTQAVSQQTGVSQKVTFNETNSTVGFEAMNGPQDIEPEVATESILDNLVENAQSMAQEPEREIEIEQ